MTAHLNHCNGIQEYHGPVIKLTVYEYDMPLREHFVGSMSDARMARTANLDRWRQWLADCKTEYDRLTQKGHTDWAADCQTAIDKWANRPDAWGVEGEILRP